MLVKEKDRPAVRWQDLKDQAEQLLEELIELFRGACAMHAQCICIAHLPRAPRGGTEGPLRRGDEGLRPFQALRGGNLGP